MKKTLIIVESPVKAKKIQGFLGDNYIVKSSYGHIRDLSKNKYLGIDIKNNFKLYYQILDNKKEVLNELINTAIGCDKILVASDPDREGEKIAHDLKVILESSGKQIKRISFNEITKDAIIKAIENPIDVDINLLKAQEARRALDRIVGYLVSPFLINHFSSNLSAGRVQSVAVRMISDRDDEINKFTPKEYWNLFINFMKNNKSYSAKFTSKISSKDELDIVKNNLSNKYIVSNISSKDKKEKPPAPMITSKLQQIMASKFSFDAERTMKSAQNLYEHGYCTYIRTDSTQVSDEAMSSLRGWIKENKLPIAKKINSYKDGKASQGAHECIRPTNVNVEKIALDNDDQKVYDVIRKYFIASQMDDAIFGITEITITNNNYSFKLSGKILKQKGYLEIFDFDNNDEILPAFQKNEVLTIDNKKPFIEEQKFTQPPPRYTDASLIKELEKRQIGRPATFAEILKKISYRNYVEKKGNSYYITKTGKEITDELSKFFSFMNYDFTAQLENNLDEISFGNTDYLTVLSNFYNTFNSELMRAYSNYLVNKKICKKCNNPMLELNGKFGKFYKCINFSCQATETYNEKLHGGLSP